MMDTGDGDQKPPKVRWGRTISLKRIDTDPVAAGDAGTLPSKKAHDSDFGTLLSRATMRDKVRKMKRAQSRKHSTMGWSHGEARTLANPSVTDIELTDVSHLDDIDGEDDEETHLKKLKAIKEMPTSIAVKRRIRDKILTEPVKISQGCRHWRYKQSVSWNKTKIACREFSLSLELWRSSFHTIEGHFGSGVASYFVFLKWLFFLNIYISFLFLLLILVPQVIFTSLGSLQNATVQTNVSAADLLSAQCTDLYDVAWNQNDTLQLILDFFSGTGYLEQTELFIGEYVNTDVVLGVFEDISYQYNMPLAYLCVTGAYILISLVLMSRHTASSFRESLVSSEDTHYQYCNNVFGGWDYALSDPKNSELKHKSLNAEFVGDLAEERDEVRRQNRTTSQMCCVYTARICINILVLGILGGSAYLIVFASQETVTLTQSPDFSTYHAIVKYLIEFLPSLTITVLNVLVPFLFKKFVLVEDYKPVTEIQLTLIRTVFLRLASVIVLIATLYTQIECTGTEDLCSVSTDSNTCPVLRCWETYVGQQLYKLVVLDFIITMIKPIVLEFPRKLIVTKCSCKLAKMIGLKEFVITDNVLNLVYSQTICWLGAFFSPLIPPITMLKFFLLFYIQKVTLLYTHVPSKRPYRASKSNSFFMIVLLASFATCCLPLGWVIAKMTPSKGCGPFRAYGSCIEVITETMATWPSWFQDGYAFLASAGFVIPLFIVLVLAIYYLSAVLSGHKKMVYVLKDQLVLEGRDKQFLLTRINQLSGKTPVKNDNRRIPPKIVEDVDNQSQVIRQRKTHASTTNIDETRGASSPPGVPLDLYGEGHI